MFHQRRSEGIVWSNFREPLTHSGTGESSQDTDRISYASPEGRGTSSAQEEEEQHDGEGECSTFCVGVEGKKDQVPVRHASKRIQSVLHNPPAGSIERWTMPLGNQRAQTCNKTSIKVQLKTGSVGCKER